MVLTSLRESKSEHAESSAVELTPASPTGRRGSAAQQPDGTQDSWFRRHRPRKRTWQLGAFGGVFLPDPKLELFEQKPMDPSGGYEQLRPLNANVGARVGYLFLPFLGAELEGALSPAQTYQTRQDAKVWNAKAQLLGQIPRGRIVPFATAGAGMVGVVSDKSAVGRDSDLMVHMGGGVKFLINRNSLVRLDLRDVVSHRQGVDTGASHSLEASLGVSVVLGGVPKQKPPEPPKPLPPPPPPAPVVQEPVDPCAQDYDGDPLDCPTYDSDQDGVPDLQDQCAQEPGPEPLGCPERDGDGDGLFDREDACPTEPETVNGFEDVDGCPDEIPEQVKAFSGVIQGIQFLSGKSTITKSSREVLDGAIKTLLEYESIHLEIAGYTDDRGNDESNTELSLVRAQAVRDYLVERGIASNRLSTRGFGEANPIASNQSKKGRAQNRRIEFHLVTQRAANANTPEPLYE